MTAAVEVECRRCGRRYSQHAAGGGPAPDGGCPGFRWVDVDAPAVGSYREPPQAPNG